MASHRNEGQEESSGCGVGGAGDAGDRAQASGDQQLQSSATGGVSWYHIHTKMESSIFGVVG